MTSKSKLYASAIGVGLVLCVISNAQTQTNTATGINHTAPVRIRSEFRFDLFAQRRATMKAFSPVGFSLMPAASAKVNSSLVTPMAALNLPVLGSGTIGRLTKWTGFTSSNSIIGDTTIFEDKLGNVGIGTDTPMSRLTVAGTIQSLSGGFKFPDGTLQTTATVSGLQAVFHDLTLQGIGTPDSPLGVAIPLRLTRSAPGNTPVLDVTNNGENGLGIDVFSDAEAVLASSVHSNAVTAYGGGSLTGDGSDGVLTLGGFSRASGQRAGAGIEAFRRHRL